MNVRTLAFGAATLSLLGGVASAKEPAKSAKAPPVAKSADASPAANQQLAEAIGNRLTSTNVAQNADVSVVTDNGTVTVSGPCGSAAQRKAIIDEVRVVAGVKMVRDGMTVGSGVMQAQGVGPLAAQPQFATPPNGGGMAMSGPLVEPAPVGMPGAGTGDGAAPPLPPYAWPTYAPHNNVSRVGYPTAYPYNAFPFIGPFYPFPKVPLGWRSVTMTWEDGHWWYGRTSTPQDYWRVRFW